MPKAPRPHRFFAVNREKAECVDCRLQVEIPDQGQVVFDVNRLNDPGYKLTYRRWVDGELDYTMGYCKAEMLYYFNPTVNTLNLASLGLGKIQPESFFALGNATSTKIMKQYAPQVWAMNEVKRNHTVGFDLLPYTAVELVKYTTPQDLEYNNEFLSVFVGSIVHSVDS